MRVVKFKRGSAPNPGSVARGAPQPRSAPSRPRFARRRYAALQRVQNSRCEPHKGLHTRAGRRLRVTGRISRSRGRRIVEAERLVGSGDLASLSEEDLLSFVLKELEPFVEK